MNNILKTKLKQHNIPLNETQLNILFLLHSRENSFNTEELLQAGNFALSSLLFNLNNLQNIDLLDSHSTLTQYNLSKNTLHLSSEGKSILEKIDKLCSNIYKHSREDEKEHINLYDMLCLYEEEFNKAIGRK